jgi:hypothetical protein
MAAKKVLLLINTDRFSFPLIRYLTAEGKRYGWKTCIGSMFDKNITARIKKEKFSSDPDFIDITSSQQCDGAIRKVDLVIGIMSEVMLLQVADSCITHRKNLISPSRLNRQMALKKSLAEENKVLLLFDCGFAPGLDHITAKKAIDNIHSKGGKITSFQTYSGSLVLENSIDNPCEFKLTEPASDLINFGKQNNRHLIHGRLQHIPYHRLFERSEPVSIREMENLVAIPEGDSLYYRKIYELSEAMTVVKGKLVRKGFDQMWNLVIKLGLTDNLSRIDFCSDKSFYHFLESLLPYSPSESLELRLQNFCGADTQDIEKLKWLGLFGNEWLEGYKELTCATIFQHLLENKLMPRGDDKDCILMKHQLEYEYREEHYKFTAALISESENQQDSALAKAIGYISGAAAKSILLGNIGIKGLHIPVIKEIYDPILNELDDLGVAFHVEDKKISHPETNAVG